MTATQLTADNIARFLQDNPEFFTQHANVFADLRVPHPHQAGAISLGERQIMTLRARSRDLEWQLSGLIQNATGNERISKLLIDWCASLLAEDRADRVPDLIVQGLARVFDLPDIALRLWDLPKLDASSRFAAEISPGARRAAQELTRPYCGSAEGQEGASWLPEAPASLALLPLRTGTDARTVGLLVLGSPDAARFSPDMGTEFLQTIATLASASLSRLDEPDQPSSA